MHQGSPLADVIRRVDAITAQARDVLAPARSLRLTTEDGGVFLALAGDREATPYALTDLVHQQLAGLTGIPHAYYRRLQEVDPPLLAANTNAWLQRLPGRQLVRTLRHPDTPILRALVSDRFRPLDHHQLLAAVLPTLHAQGMRILSSELTASRLYLKAVSERVRGEVRLGETVMAGIIISNSEVGAGALTMQPLIYTLRCTNGLILEDDSLRRQHVGRRFEGGDLLHDVLSDEARVADDRAFFLKVRDLAQATMDEALFHHRLRDLARRAAEALPAGGEERLVDVTARRFHLSTQEGAGILAHLRAGGDLSAWGLVSAVTRHAQDVRDYDRSTELERIGGRLLGDASWTSSDAP